MKQWIKLIFYSIVFVSSLFLPKTVKAWVAVESTPVANTFTFAPTYSVTTEYYYVDENDVQRTLQASVINNYFYNDVITLADDLITNLDYYQVEYYVDNSLYSGSTYNVTSNVTIKEVYYMNKYNINYYLNRGINSPSNPSSYTAKSGNITLSAPTRQSATFIGWTWEGQNTPQLNVSFSANDKEDKTFTANWQLSVYTLINGPDFNNYVTNDITDVIFGFYSDYPSFTPGTGTFVGNTPSDLIYTHTSGTTLYVLSERIISFNYDSSMMFHEKVNVASIDFDNIYTGNVADMSLLFAETSMASLDLSNFDTSNVLYMTQLFADNPTITSINLSSFNTSNVTNMSGMFLNTSAIEEVDFSNFDTSNVTSMAEMFESALSIKSLDLSNFDTSNVINMSLMFATTPSLVSINLSSFDTSNVEFMSDMFAEASALTTLDLSNFNTSNVTQMTEMFMDATSLTTIDISNFEATSLVNISDMFSGDTSLTTIYASDSFNVNNVLYHSNVFTNDTLLVGGNGTTYDPSHIDKEYARIDATGTPGYFTAKVSP